MLFIEKKHFGWWTGRRGVGAGMALALLNGIASAIFAVHAQAAVIEFFNPDLNNYFITADPVEQAFVDTGGVGRWQRTGYAFAAGGPNQVCRFGGNSDINPATGTFFGPNSHFYTANAAECDGLKAIYTLGAKSWKFESNDFLTTPAVNGGCPAGLVPVYRAYNNGFPTIDSNHRITSNYAAYLQTVAAGSIGEGVVMCAPSGPPPIATAVGVATGSATSATIGAAGGSVSAPDGKLVLTIPAGALAANTVISIQPITNLAHGKIGTAYRLKPDGQTFLHPVTLRFTYTDDDLLGTAAEFLGAAFQTAAGYWQWLGAATLDTTAKTVSVSSSHFTDVSGVKGLQIRPQVKTVQVNRTVGLQVKVCFHDDSGYDDVASFGSDCDTDQGIVATLSVNEWSVNDVPGGNGATGTVSGSGPTATYLAPTTTPNPATVRVSARVHDPKKGPLQVVSNITIVDAYYHVSVDQEEYDSGLPCAVARSAVVSDHFEFNVAGTGNGSTRVVDGFVNGTTVFSTPVVDPPATYTVTVDVPPEWHTFTAGSATDIDGHVTVLATGTSKTGGCISHNGSSSASWPSLTSDDGFGFDFEKANFVGGTQTLTETSSIGKYTITITAP